MSEMIHLYALRDTQCLGSLANIPWLDPEDGSITPCAGSNGLHGCDINPSLFQLAKYVGDSTYTVLALNQESSLGPHQLDPCFLCCRKEGISVGGHEGELSTPAARWETIEGNQIDTSCLECIENLSTRSSLIGNHSTVVLNTPHDGCHGIHLLRRDSARLIIGGSGCAVKEKHPTKVCLQDDCVKRRSNEREGLPRVPKDNSSLVVLFH